MEAEEGEAVGGTPRDPQARRVKLTGQQLRKGVAGIILSRRPEGDVRDTHHHPQAPSSLAPCSLLSSQSNRCHGNWPALKNDTEMKEMSPKDAGSRGAMQLEISVWA